MHWYGKHEVSEKRKVGHITIVAPDNFQARQRLRCIDAAAAAALEATTTDAAATGLIYMPGGQTHCPEAAPSAISHIVLFGRPCALCSSLVK